MELSSLLEQTPYLFFVVIAARQLLSSWGGFVCKKILRFIWCYFLFRFEAHSRSYVTKIGGEKSPNKIKRTKQINPTQLLTRKLNSTKVFWCRFFTKKGRKAFYKKRPKKGKNLLSYPGFDNAEEQQWYYEGHHDIKSLCCEEGFEWLAVLFGEYILESCFEAYADEGHAEQGDRKSVV